MFRKKEYLEDIILFKCDSPRPPLVPNSSQLGVIFAPPFQGILGDAVVARTGRGVRLGSSG